MATDIVGDSHAPSRYRRVASWFDAPVGLQRQKYGVDEGSRFSNTEFQVVTDAGMCIGEGLFSFILLGEITTYRLPVIVRCIPTSTRLSKPL